MVTPEEREFMWNFYAPEPRMRLNLGIRRRLAPLLGNDQRRIRLAHSLLLTFIGSPVLYYGDEIGMGDNIWLDDRNGVRTPMQWNDQLPTRAFQPPRSMLYAPVIDDDAYGYQRVNVQAQQADRDSLFNWLQTCAARAARASGFWTRRHSTGCRSIHQPSLRTGAQHEHDRVLVLHNLSDRHSTDRVSRLHRKAGSIYSHRHASRTAQHCNPINSCGLPRRNQASSRSSMTTTR